MILCLITCLTKPERFIKRNRIWRGVQLDHIGRYMIIFNEVLCMQEQHPPDALPVILRFHKGTGDIAMFRNSNDACQVIIIICPKGRFLSGFNLLINSRRIKSNIILYSMGSIRLIFMTSPCLRASQKDICPYYTIRFMPDAFTFPPVIYCMSAYFLEEHTGIAFYLSVTAISVARPVRIT